MSQYNPNICLHINGTFTHMQVTLAICTYSVQKAYLSILPLSVMGLLPRGPVHPTKLLFVHLSAGYMGVTWARGPSHEPTICPFHCYCAGMTPWRPRPADAHDALPVCLNDIRCKRAPIDWCSRPLAPF